MAKRRMRNSRKAAMRRKRRRQVLFGLILLCILLVWGITSLVLYQSVSKYPEKKICKNIYIGPVEVSGMTEKEAVKVVEAHLEEDNQIKVTLKVGEKEAESTLEELGIGFKDVKKAVKEAVKYGKEGSLWSRYRKIKKLNKEKLVIDKNVGLDEEKATAVFKEKAVPLTNHAVDASITKTADGFDIEEEKSGNTIDIKASIASLEEYLNTEWKHKDFSFKMVQKKEKPKVKASDLESISDELGTFSTDAGGGERWQNLQTGAEKLSGTIIMPGQEVSVHDLTAPYDEEHGYVPAGSYENGQVVDTYGGGICQVSTTLYNALLFAELEITKRYPHSMLINYVDPSRDAAIAGDTKDLRFKNNYDTPVYLYGEIDENNQLHFTVYGKDTREEGREIEFESETIDKVEYEVVYKVNSEAPLGSMNTTQSPHTGRSAQLWKIVYQDGKEVSRDVINKSNYNKSDQVIEVGTKSSNPEASSLVANAVATQDKEKIKAAINQAAGM